MASGKGGTGKSTMTAAIGRALARQGKRVLLADMDAGVRALELMLSADSLTHYNWLDAATGKARVQDAVSSLGQNLSLLHAPNEGGVQVEPSEIKEMLSALSANFDYILCDSSAGVGQSLKIAAAASDAAIIVTVPDKIAVSAAAAASEFLFSEGVEDISLIVNKFSVNRLPRSKEDFFTLDDIMDTVCARLLGVVPFDSSVVSLVMGENASGKSAVEASVQRIAKRIEGESVPLPVKELIKYKG
ncbi:MAG TPA: P-loop NTPase [Clostridiales bacterium]|nr:P-loop NTPase [Clostridiales bacterium]